MQFPGISSGNTVNIALGDEHDIVVGLALFNPFLIEIVIPQRLPVNFTKGLIKKRIHMGRKTVANDHGGRQILVARELVFDGLLIGDRWIIRTIRAFVVGVRTIHRLDQPFSVFCRLLLCADNSRTIG